LYTHGYHLKTDADFDNAIYFGLIVSITHKGQHLGSGHILSHSNNVVKVIHTEMLKSNNEFTVCLLMKA
jgi:hypothetical protein